MNEQNQGRWLSAKNDFDTIARTFVLFRCKWIADLDYFLFFFLIQKIYDIQTGNKLLTLFNPDLANNYKKNCATFNPTDDLVLNDGVLWDVRSAQAIHKFDKFNMTISGVFHPNGLEVIVNTEIVSFVPELWLTQWS